MATIKSFTDLSQSKKLAEFLPLESADNYYSWHDERYYVVNKDCPYPYSLKEKIPCWSLAALLNLLPNNEHISTNLSRGGWKIEPPEYVDKWWCEYEDDDHTRDFSVSADNLVDACVDMIEKLHELNLL